MTVHELVERLAAANVTIAVSGGNLELEGDVPAELQQPLVILQTGIRATLTRRQWWGCRSEDGRLVPLYTNATIPAGVTILCVDGDGSNGATWDRIHPAARIDSPELFERVEVKESVAA